MVLCPKEQNSCRKNLRKTLQKMFACRKPKQRFEGNNVCLLYFELKKLKRPDLVDILQNELNGEGLHHVLEIHGGNQTQVHLDCPAKQINMRILINVDDEIQKYEKLLHAAADFADEVIIFHSLDKHFKSSRRMISDRASCDTIIVCEPIARYFELCRNVSVYHLENIAESLKQETHEDEKFELEMIRFSNCNIQDDHVIPLQNLIKYTKKLDLNGNGRLSPQSFDILSISMSIQKPSKLTYLNLSNCNLTDAHISSLQSILVRVEELDLSYNEDMTPKVMKTLSDSIIECIQLGEDYLNKLVLAGCNMTAEHVKQFYRCISFLEHLDLSMNNKLSAYAMTIISDAIMAQVDNHRSRALTLRLEHCQITDSHIENLKECIPLLKELDLSWNELSVESIETIAEALYERKGGLNLKSLILMGCELTDKHLVEIAECVIYLESLNIGYNQILCSECLKLFAEHIGNSRAKGIWCSFRTLRIGGMELDNYVNHLNKDNSRVDMLGLHVNKRRKNKLGKTIDFLSSLEELDLSGNSKFTPFTAKMLSESIVKINELKVDCFLRKLNLSNCNLLDSHIEMILSCLVYLIALDISANPRLTPAAMKIIGECVIGEHDDLLLQYLNIGSCGLTDSHIKSLDGCYVNVKNVDISKNKLTCESMELILQYLDKASKINCKTGLECMHVSQAFSVREYSYRKFESNARKYNVNIVSVNL